MKIKAFILLLSAISLMAQPAPPQAKSTHARPPRAAGNPKTALQAHEERLRAYHLVEVKRDCAAGGYEVDATGLACGAKKAEKAK